MVGGAWDGFRKVKARREHNVCAGCDGSWIWADRVNDTRWCCDHCGLQWVAGKDPSKVLERQIKQAGDTTRLGRT